MAPAEAQRPPCRAAEQQRWPLWTLAVSRALRIGAGAPRGPLALPAGWPAGWPADWVAVRLRSLWTLAVSRALQIAAGSPRGPPDLPVWAAEWAAAGLPSSTTPAQGCLVWAGLSPPAANRGRRHGSQSTAQGPPRIPTARQPGLRRWSRSRSQFVSAFARLQIGAQIYRRLWRLTSLGCGARPRDAGALQSSNSQAQPMTERAKHIWSAIVATLERADGSGRWLATWSQWPLPTAIRHRI